MAEEKKDVFDFNMEALNNLYGFENYINRDYRVKRDENRMEDKVLQLAWAIHKEYKSLESDEDIISFTQKFADLAGKLDYKNPDHKSFYKNVYNLLGSGHGVSHRYNLFSDTLSSMPFEKKVDMLSLNEDMFQIHWRENTKNPPKKVKPITKEKVEHLLSGDSLRYDDKDRLAISCRHLNLKGKMKDSNGKDEVTLHDFCLACCVRDWNGSLDYLSDIADDRHNLSSLKHLRTAVGKGTISTKDYAAKMITFLNKQSIYDKEKNRHKGLTEKYVELFVDGKKSFSIEEDAVAMQLAFKDIINGNGNTVNVHGLASVIKGDKTGFYISKLDDEVLYKLYHSSLLNNDSKEQQSLIVTRMLNSEIFDKESFLKGNTCSEYATGVSAKTSKAYLKALEEAKQNRVADVEQAQEVVSKHNTLKEELSDASVKEGKIANVMEAIRRIKESVQRKGGALVTEQMINDVLSAKINGDEDASLQIEKVKMPLLFGKEKARQEQLSRDSLGAKFDVEILDVLRHSELLKSLNPDGLPILSDDFYNITNANMKDATQNRANLQAQVENERRDVYQAGCVVMIDERAQKHIDEVSKRIEENKKKLKAKSKANMKKVGVEYDESGKVVKMGKGSKNIATDIAKSKRMRQGKV